MNGYSHNGKRGLAKDEYMLSVYMNGDTRKEVNRSALVYYSEVLDNLKKDSENSMIRESYKYIEEIVTELRSRL